MAYYVHSERRINKGKLTIGLIPENSANEDENKIRLGVIESAKKHNVNLVCFTHLEAITKNSVSYGYEAKQYLHNHDRLQQLIEQFEQDGLLFLGWSVLFDNENLKEFSDRFIHLPLLSLGKTFPDIPSVFVEGGHYVREILLHLINQHQYKNIAFVEPWKEDNRKNEYIQTMEEYGAYNPELFISAQDLSGVMLSERPQRALEILLDEREVKVDAILLMRSEEARLMLEQLKQRGLNVPNDIAITSYEDDLSIQYASPPVTTVYFPFWELGFAGCEKLIELLRQGKIPLSTSVPGRVLYRNSCGCMHEQEQFNGSDAVSSPIADSSYPADEGANFGLNVLLEQSLRMSIENNSLAFLTTLQTQLKQNISGHNDYQKLISRYRSFYSSDPGLSEGEKARLEDLWHLCRVVISESEKSWIANDMIRKRNRDLTLEEFSQSLLNTFSIPKILDVLEFNLGLLAIRSCNIFLSKSKERRFEECDHIYGFIDNRRSLIKVEEVNIKQYMRHFIREEDQGRILIVSLLHVEMNDIGFICFEPGPLEGMLYLRLAIQLSNALIGTIMVDQLTYEIKLRKEKEKQLTYYAQFDTATALLNRRSLYDGISLIGTTSDFCMLYLDVDGFKNVNDSLGHDAGDLLLIELSNRIKSVLKNQLVKLPKYLVSDNDREVDALFRIGGDEFAAIINHSGHGEVEDLTQQLIDHVRTPYYIKNSRVTISCSIGISCYPADTRDGKLLIQYADIAMYQAKKAGGSNYKFFNPYMEQESLMKLELENHLRQALDNHELFLHYQPQVDCSTGEIIGVEALLRWVHPTIGNISPATFIPIAEESGLIVTIGDWVLLKACEQLRIWQEEGLPPLIMAVNLSVKQFMDGKLVEKVRSVLETTGIDARLLELEITENVAMTDDQFTMIHELRNLGVAISVDDFGTQYSSLSYLKRFPVTKLKLDQSFVRGILSDPKDMEMVRAIIFVAKAFELDIIAEGVETLSEAECLLEMGCSLMQGYYFHRPMLPENISQLFN
jgi:diguanylate cyclase (GGDEF)-like protein